MIRNFQKFFNAVNVVTDGLTIVLSYYLSTWVWLDLFRRTPDNIAFIRSWTQETGIAAILYTLIMLLLLAVFGLYNTTRIRRIRQNVLIILEANALGVLAVGAALFTVRALDFSRGVLVLFFLCSSALMAFKRVLMSIALNRAREKGFNHKTVIVVGTGGLARQYAQNVGKDRLVGFTIVGYFGTPRENFQGNYLGGIDEIEPYIRMTSVDEVVVALEPNETDNIRTVITTCESTGVRVAVIPFYNDIIPSCPAIEVLGSVKLIYLRNIPLDNAGYAFIKRLSDLTVGALFLLLLSPLMLAAAALIKLTSPGKVLFKQQRVGRNKKLFWMYKFRSMRENAEQTADWTTRNDERRTRFGRILRKLSIDELPQLFNVLKGEMSLIGPRPEIPLYVEKFAKNIPLYMVKHQIRPGMTGWAQVNGYRGDTSIEKRIEYDIWYIENWRLSLDFKILLRTLLGAWMNPESLT